MATDFPHRIANLSDPAPEFPWPNGNRCAVFPAFDVDAETAWLQYDPKNTDRLVTLSFGGYEERVGVPKILDYLRSVEIKATFFIPGWVVDVHPKMCEAIVKDGHEVGHHGYSHKRPDPDDFSVDKEEIDKTFESFRRILGVVPVGYRAPSGENYDELLAYLRDKGIAYSSSFRDDIRPYRHTLRDGSKGPVELPVNMSFDDWLYGLSQRFSPRPMFPKEHVLSIWNDELDQTREWGGLVSMVMHPQVSGRPMRLGIMRDFLARARDYGDVWIATGKEIAEHFVAQEKAAGL
ncbi:polysaccharide deacetylase family protein [Bosea sp. PAMC 26642]|uniref:polysaccharide deacetylase family protein n=1 Tax=Bosea sp. (strain PAMC 26642) TaxID=1792307 RepID=UPI000770606F|nr:polysaccharide deacetylase [Bosea sp. PAMC 26642]AMJ60978.1 polysaccharide deacetylase [Bosea sp. PAMC 26642]